MKPNLILSNRILAIGYSLLAWGLVDRPPMMIVAAVFILGGYAGIQQSPHESDTP